MSQTFANLKSVCLMKQLMCVWGVWFLFPVKISIDIKNKVFEFCPTPAVEEAAATFNCWSFSSVYIDGMCMQAFL